MTAGPFSLSLATIHDPARHVQYGFETIGPDVWITDAAAKGNVQIVGVPEPATLNACRHCRTRPDCRSPPSVEENWIGKRIALKHTNPPSLGLTVAEGDWFSCTLGMASLGVCGRRGR